MRPSTTFNVVSFLFLACLSACTESSAPVDRILPDGLLHGVAYTDTEVFKGIPYAEPPTGALRWKPPVKNASYPTGRDALASGPICSQRKLGETTIDPTSSEDCLYLNVWLPRQPGPSPVMIYFPGGAYVIGGAAEPEFDGRKLSKAGHVIVVVASYRLGPLGFASHKALASEDPAHPNSGNYGLLDQREVMRWVQRNIYELGGDTSRITIFGESAGAGSVCVHTVSPGSKGLFTSAIMQSPPCTAYPFPDRAKSEAQGEQLATALGCSGDDASVRSCMRAHTSDEVIEALPLKTHIIYGPGVDWGPVVDGDVLPDQPLTLLAHGDSADVPVIVGSNADEGTLFFAENDSINTEADLRSLLGELFPPATVEATIAHYPITSSAKGTANHILGDIFVCDARRIARYHAAAGRRAYRYYFARAFFDIILDLGSFHGAELPFVFGNALKGLPVLLIGRPLRDAIQGYWTTLAAAGDPNGGKRPMWSPYDPISDISMRLDLPVAAAKGVRAADCDFWDTQRTP